MYISLFHVQLHLQHLIVWPGLGLGLAWFEQSSNQEIWQKTKKLFSLISTFIFYVWWKHFFSLLWDGMPQKLTQVQFLVLPKVKVQFVIWEILIQHSLVRSELIRSQSSHEIHTYLSFLCYLTLSRWKLSSSWWWPFQSTLLPFGPKPQIKQTKKRLCVYLLARQGIPIKVLFFCSDRNPRSNKWRTDNGLIR